jgi:quercetin dioxygenase-like cupin family protein
MEAGIAKAVMINVCNLGQLEEYDSQHFVRKEVTNGAQSKSVLLNLLPGQEIPTHGHNGSEVLLVPQKGQALLTVDGTTDTLLQPGTVYGAGDESTFRILNNGSEPCQILVILVRLAK